MDADECGTPALAGKFAGIVLAGTSFGKSAPAGTLGIEGIPGWVGSRSRMDDIEPDGFDGILG